ncbi:MAG: AbrB/MazE/SpoVT family DNA-binding domain-containing protein [Candidatus Bathyarchaeota archaeon]|nr:AbrB/MazE/SpoVT family DNA-binding domain-containing protein [Candidatus Bathyarchaeota archaeon]
MTAVVKVDEKGRVVIPKNIREKTKMKEGGYVKIIAKEKSIIIEPLEPFADKYFGAFKIDKWPEDLDEFAVEVIKKWWTSKAT